MVNGVVMLVLWAMLLLVDHGPQLYHSLYLRCWWLNPTFAVVKALKASHFEEPLLPTGIFQEN